MSLRYRFAEKYSLTEDPNRPEQLVQYQVGVTDTRRTEVERPQGAPQQVGFVQRTIYTERPARLGRVGEVTDAVRRYDRYDRFSLNGTRQADPRVTSLFRDLTLWYRVQSGKPPEVIILTANRPLREVEYNEVSHQLFLPRLKSILPLQPTRVADTWAIGRQAAQALVGDLPEGGDVQLDGTLVRVDRAAQGSTLSAIIDVSGSVGLDEGEGVVKARITFVFEPPPAAPAGETKDAAARAGGTGRDAGVVDAIGYINKVQMRRQVTTPLEDEPRLQQTQTRDLIVHRRRPTGQPGGADATPLTVPEQPPAADELNSWLLFDDPAGRFHLRHPQELAFKRSEDAFFIFEHVRPDGRDDTVAIGDVPREADPALDRRLSDPQALVKSLKDAAVRRNLEVIPGPMGYLPDPDWAPLKRKVYRYEAGHKQPEGSRVYLDAYLVLFNRGDHFVIQAWTGHNDHVAFRDKIEKMIRSLDLGPSGPAGAGAAERPQVAPPAATRPNPGSPAPAVPPRGTP